MKTPYYQYDLQLLRQTLDAATREANKYGYTLHYAVKANANPVILNEISSYGLGADCVSGNEISAALSGGFNPKGIVFAGVGKTDEEIELAIARGIYCIHCESVQELMTIQKIASAMQTTANVALRVNPNVDAHTHKHITTGTMANKFGLTVEEARRIIKNFDRYSNLNLFGLHFHIGSQITEMNVFEELAQRVNELQHDFYANGEPAYLNLGGGLGINYQNPDSELIPPFMNYFDVFARNLNRNSWQSIHFELGRSLVGQCGKLVTRVLYTKKMGSKNFAIVDAGMNALIRPALYGAYHRIVNTSTSSSKMERYEVVGPLCESTDILGTNVLMPVTQRNDVLEVLSCGAYAEAMSSRINLRDIPDYCFTNQLQEKTITKTGAPLQG
ncbi:MAG TPA: diaminopimelate decarboxylase [Tenuifilaceae bacterium]|jgi:diaminopimelate decarboxylase|nr:diaminopimelate decarboxylase [Bacteroidales bacterium]HNT40785.1 diaminopimelate decarboxylase [Tenuifilaceae bacterium]MBP8644280.1 diaminopimelate decarboxylase [Bacteroidales bacterium]NLI87802.1 diaminopimelate decarboxylase [Bacteroidales bacterium]HNY08278.1 diaminopimelate decarboxylase [Tenuifilaceae bacterium]